MIFCVFSFSAFVCRLVCIYKASRHFVFFSNHSLVSAIDDSPLRFRSALHCGYSGMTDIKDKGNLELMKNLALLL